jgi:hypothetical protein
MHDNALHSLESLQLAPHKVTKHGGKVRPAPRIDTAVKPAMQPGSASSGGTLVSNSPASTTSRVYSLRNYLTGALGFGNNGRDSESK